jgi:F-type H+-transporting ATPase subunit delta
MADLTTIARPYAKAVFEQARTGKSLEKWSEQLALLVKVTEDPLMRTFLDSPNVDSREKCQAVLDVGAEGLGVEAGNFVRLLAENRRLDVLGSIATVYEDFRAEAEQSIEAEVVSARALTKEQEKRLTSALKKRLGREVTIKCTVDKNLIGGAVIRAGDLVIDGCVPTKLNQLAASLDQ